jgi:hypothetical protein
VVLDVLDSVQVLVGRSALARASEPTVPSLMAESFIQAEMFAEISGIVARFKIAGAPNGVGC